MDFNIRIADRIEDNQKVVELQEWERESALSLPYPIKTIIRLENMGYIVDLDTGDIFTPFPQQ